MNIATPVNIQDAIYTFINISYVGTVLNTVTIHISRNTTVPIIVIIDGSSDLPIPLNAALSTSYIAVRPYTATLSLTVYILTYHK